MNTPYIGDTNHSSQNVERIDPVENTNAYGGNTPTILEMPMGAPVDKVVPMNGEHVNVIPVENPGPAGNLMDRPAIQTPVASNNESPTALLNQAESEHFRTRWNEIQGTFVDEPRLAVQQADALVSEVIGQITTMFASNHSTLEGQWKQGNDVSTEDLRKALQHYRSFFKRLVV